jgi:predicted HTH domain antitoxin
MAGSPIDGGVQSKPNGSPDAPLRHFSNQFGAIEAALQFVIDDPAEVAAEIFEAVLDLPREQRFSESIVEVESVVTPRIGSEEVLKTQLREFEPDDFVSLPREQLDSLLEDTIERVFFVRDASPTLVICGAYEIARQCSQIVGENQDDDLNERALSSMVALIARLYEGSTAETVGQEWLEALATDVLWASHAVRENTQSESDAIAEEFEPSEALEEAVRFGAVVAYARLDISVSRGAELAGLPVADFEQELKRYDVQIRYGPTSTDDLEGNVLNDE